MASEKRMIDANQLKTDMYLLATLGNNENIFIDVIIDEIDNADEVDAVEVVHGHMVERIVDHEFPAYKVFDCSECGCDVEIWHNYCPNCGAKMDGDSE